MDTSSLLVLIDGSSYLFRAFYGLPALTGPNNVPTGALHGVFKMIRSLRQSHQPRYFAVVFDAPGKTFRHEWFPAYKANRPAMPPELSVQIAPLQDLIRALGIPLIIQEGVEADDVIGTLVHRALAQDFEVLVSSSDKDLAQLLDDGNVTLLDTMKNEITRTESVARRFKVDRLNANQVIDFLALVGDSSDNIPGVPKVGPKTAAKWLEQYGDLDNIIKHANEITGKIGENLRNNLDQLRLSYRLARIDCDLDLDINIGDLSVGEVQQHKLLQLCEQYGLNSIRRDCIADGLLQEQDEAIAITSPSEATHKESCAYHLLRQEQLPDLIARLQKTKQFSIDTETTSQHYRLAELVGISLCLDGKDSYYLPLAHADQENNLSFDETLAQLRPILENQAIGKIGHHLKYDRHVFKRYGIELQGVLDDSMLASYVYDATACRHNLDDLADYYLNIKTIPYETLVRQGNKKRNFKDLSSDEAQSYACEDADISRRLYHFFMPRLHALPQLQDLYENMERPLATILYHMEEQGVLIDSTMLAAQSERFKQEIARLETQAYELAGQTFNLNSPKQLQSILFEDLNLPVIRKTAMGQPSTDEDSLQALAFHHPLPACILSHRTLSKLKSTYTDKLPQMIDPRSGRIHPSYHQAVTSTGRLSCSDPNLQNIPVRDQAGREIRQAFIAPSGYRILACDYSQIELRIMAHLSGDENMLQAFHRQDDIHRATAAEVLGKRMEDVSDDERRSAKAVNFGLIYGMSAFGLARQLGISRAAAADYIERYFSRYPGVQTYMQENIRLAKQQGFIETLYGRRLYLPQIRSKSARQRQAAERLAINAPMQGSAADIIKRAMLNIQQRLPQDDRLRLIMQVHDELVFEIKEGCEDLIEEINHCMEDAAALSVPLIVSSRSGSNWDEAH